jgi:hypothetical protein
MPAWEQVTGIGKAVCFERHLHTTVWDPILAYSAKDLDSEKLYLCLGACHYRKI